MNEPKNQKGVRKHRADLADLFEASCGQVLFHESLAPRTYYKLGGPAQALYFPRDVNCLVETLSKCSRFEIPVMVLGNGTNVLFSDNGFGGVVILLDELCRYIEPVPGHDTAILCGSAASLMELVLEAERFGLSGIQSLAGIPGTIGGALRMNAGAFGSEISDVVEKVRVLDTRSFEIKWLSKKDARFGYRAAKGLDAKIVLSAKLVLEPGVTSDLARERKDVLAKRRRKQPLDKPSCGSVFKRPKNDYAGRLIEAAGLKGFRVNHAWVSEKHANFIVHDGKARSSDVLSVMKEVQARVFQKFGVMLEPEVRLVGFEPEELKGLNNYSLGHLIL